MEANPIPPRQRNRRADRASDAQQVQPTPVALPPQPVYSRQAQPSYQPPVQAAQQAYPQSPRMMYQQQPVRPAAQSYPQAAQPMPQSPAPQPRPVQQPVRPRALNQGGTANTVWQQPTLQPEAPRARAGSQLNRETARAGRIPHQEEAAPKAKPARKKVPGWMTTALSLAFVLVMALCAAYWLMQAYLTTQENTRIAAYEAVLENHHITRAQDGTLRITWQDEIEKYAAQYNLQPAFVAAIIRNESSFRTNAESSVGARGLMQLMPDTAEWIAGKLDDDAYHFDRMWDGETNIRYGCWYLGYLSRLFRGDAELVSAAYHAGQSTITQWLSDPEKSSDGVTLDLDRLSDGPTKQYIGRVTQTYGIYQTLLYPDAAFGAADAVSAGGAGAAAAGR